MVARNEKLVVGAFVLSAVLAGGNAVGIRFSNMELQPYWGATLRFSLAAAMMWVVYLVMRRPMPGRNAIIGAALYGVFNFGGAFAFAFMRWSSWKPGLARSCWRSCPCSP